MTIKNLEEVLSDLWYRVHSADEAFDLIEDIISAEVAAAIQAEREDEAKMESYMAEIAEMEQPLCAQPTPSVPDGWLRAIDEALVTAHIGVANAHDTYEQAREKLNSLIGWHTDVATDPAVNGGWKLVPIDPTQNMLDCMDLGSNMLYRYRAMLAAAPETKP